MLPVPLSEPPVQLKVVAVTEVLPVRVPPEKFRVGVLSGTVKIAVPLLRLRDPGVIVPVAGLKVVVPPLTVMPPVAV